MLGPHGCMRALVWRAGAALVPACEALIVVASLVAEHRLIWMWTPAVVVHT